MKNKLTFILIFLIIIGCTKTISDTKRAEIIKQLQEINTIDQKYAGIPPQELFDKYGNKKAWQLFTDKRDSVAIEIQNKIKELYKKYGYLGYAQVGKKAAGNFWISIQHADNDVAFQKEMLAALKTEIEKDNASKAEYALLEDRVAVNLGQKQRFGTQLTYNSKGQAIPKIGIKDSLNVDKLRTEYDLPPLLEYYNMMTLSHFEMNKEYLKQLGITEPNLYPQE